MPKKIDELIRLLSPDEPDYVAIRKKLDEEDYPVLNKLVMEGDKDLAIVAICCLGRMNSIKSLEGITFAAKSADPDFREAAAIALKHMKNIPEAIELVGNLIDDEDIGVRKATLETVEFSFMNQLRGKVEERFAKETNSKLIKLVLRTVNRLDDPFVQ